METTAGTLKQTGEYGIIKQENDYKSIGLLNPLTYQRIKPRKGEYIRKWRKNK